jgi:D-glycero-alpha-D-manno-heptose 1-phosphate guanylyltransferase
MGNGELGETTAVILAGGKGTRIAHLLPDLPKPMASVAGRPFLDWILLQLARDGVGSFLLSTGHLGEVIEAHLAQAPVGGIRTRCVREDVPCGTAGGFLNAVRADCESPLGGYLVVNGDSMVLANVGSLVSKAMRQGWDGALFGLVVEDARRFGSLNVAADGLLNGFNEKGAACGVINAGVYWFSPGCVARFPSHMPLSFEFDVFPALIAGGARIGVVTVEAPFIDIGTPESMAVAEEFVRKHVGQ